MWPDLIQKAKDGGLDIIETYVFWNGHEPSPGKVGWENFFFLLSGFFCLCLCVCVFLLIFCFANIQYYFEERYDLVRFIKLVQQAGLYVHLRIGPYVCAEWNYG